VFLGWATGVLISYNTAPHSSTPQMVMSSVHFPMSIILGALLITVVGLIDDVYGVSPRVKVGGQLIAAAMLAGDTVGTNLARGLFISMGDSWGFDPMQIPMFDQITYWLGALLVVVFVVGGCNAANLLDGLDGLAGGVTAIVAAGLTFIAVALAMGLYANHGAYSLINDPIRVVTCLALLGAVLGFLPYNFHPANIFMGDTGSMLLGFLCVSTIMLFAERGDSRLVMAALIVFAVPIIDTSMAIIRRKSKGQPIFSPDNYHLHHQLTRAGFSVRQSVVMLYLMALGFAALGSALIFTRLRYVAAVFLVVLGFIFVISYKVAHRQHTAEQIKNGKLPASARHPTRPGAPGKPAPDTAAQPVASRDAKPSDAAAKTADGSAS